MKKIFFLLASVILLACSENERMVYDEHMHDIYYSIVTDTRDSLYVSLLMADQILETTVDVKMLGNVLTKPQKFKVEGGRGENGMPKKVYIMKNFLNSMSSRPENLFIKCLCG